MDKMKNILLRERRFILSKNINVVKDKEQLWKCSRLDTEEMEPEMESGEEEGQKETEWRGWGRYCYQQ